MKLLTTILLIYLLAFCGLITGCNKDKAMVTIRDAQNKAAKTLIYIKDIAKANNDAFTAHDIGSDIHRPINEAAGKALTAVNAFVDAINAAKASVAAGSDPNAQVNILKALFNGQTAGIVINLVSLVATVPPVLRDKIGIWATAIQLALDAIRGLFADLQNEMEVVNQYAG